VPGKDIPAAGKAMSVLQARRTVLRTGGLQMAGEALLGDGSAEHRGGVTGGQQSRPHEDQQFTFSQVDGPPTHRPPIRTH